MSKYGVLGALIAFGMASISTTAALAGSRYDSGCNCYRPDSFFENKRVVREGTQVRERSRRVVQTERVVPRTNVVDHNNLIVHVRPIVHKDIVLHRQNIVYRNITVHRENNTHRVAEQHRSVTINQTIPGSTRTINEVRYVKGRDCNCGGTTREYATNRY